MGMERSNMLVSIVVLHFILIFWGGPLYSIIIMGKLAANDFKWGFESNYRKLDGVYVW